MSSSFSEMDPFRDFKIDNILVHRNNIVYRKMKYENEILLQTPTIHMNYHGQKILIEVQTNKCLVRAK